MQNPKNLCLSLAYCNSENEVIKLLKKEGFWEDSKSWRDYGDRENNFGTIGNQQDLAEAALVEKITNSIDAVLMAECFKEGVDPESREAPQNIADALYRYYNVYHGKLHNVEASQRRQLAENISLIATGKKSNPCYTVIDGGEGQTPAKMPVTLLSLDKSNKLKIPFVQGKFNMGGTGVLRFCGKHSVQLVISKRHPNAPVEDGDNTKDLWGFTVVRRFRPEGNVRSSTYKYLALSGKIPSFSSESLNLLPGVYPETYGQGMQYGTFIKLFDYKITGGLKTHVNFDLYYRLSLLMPEIALPVRLYERRDFAGHSHETTLSGLMVRLQEDKRNVLEEGFEEGTGGFINIDGKKLKTSLYVFKRGKHENYLKNEGIIFTVNGQTHGHIPKTFFAREKVKMGYLKDSILVIVECPEETYQAIGEDLFMPSRDRLVSGDLKANIERQIEDFIRDHRGLKSLRNKRREEEIQNKLSEDKPLTEVIKKIFKNHPSLSKIFVGGTQLSSPFPTKVTGNTKEEFSGEKFPTFFELKRKYPKSKPKQCILKNRKVHIEYRTDACNDYFTRSEESGEFSFSINGVEEKDNWNINSWDGTATLTFNLPVGKKLDDLMHFQSNLTDVSQVMPFVEDFYIHIVEGKEHTERENLPPKNSGIDLPEPIPVRREEWEKHNFNRESALKVINNGESGYDFFINMDNIYLLSEIKSSRENVKILESRYKYGLVLIGMAILHDKNKLLQGSNSEDVTIDDQVIKITSAIAPILLPMISDLGDLELPE